MEPTRQVSIADRERAAVDARLQAAVGEGLLGLTEYDERCAALWRAQTREELDALTADLPTRLPAVADTTPPGRARRVVAVMSEDVLSGPVVAGQPTSATTIMGKAIVDLRRTDLPPQVIVRAVTLLGETAVLVPRGVGVQLSGLSVMGPRSNNVGPAEPGAPVVTVHATSVMGQVSVSHGSVRPPGAVIASERRHPGRPRSSARQRHQRHQRRWFGRVVPLVVAAAAVFGLSQVATADDGAVFGSGTTHMRSAGSERVGTLFGSYRVVVPDGARVDTSSRMLFGSVDCHAACEPGHMGPVIRVRGSGAFGSVDVVTESEAARPSRD